MNLRKFRTLTNDEKKSLAKYALEHLRDQVGKGDYRSLREINKSLGVPKNTIHAMARRGRYSYDRYLLLLKVYPTLYEDFEGAQGQSPDPVEASKSNHVEMMERVFFALRAYACSIPGATLDGGSCRLVLEDFGDKSIVTFRIKDLLALESSGGTMLEALTDFKDHLRYRLAAEADLLRSQLDLLRQAEEAIK